MKIILALIGFVTCSIATSAPKLLVCQNLTGQENFDAKKYFSGKWYTTDLQRGPQTSDVCQVSKSDVLEDGTINHIIFTYTKRRNPQFLPVNCKGSMKNVINGKTDLDCRVQSFGGVQRIQLQTTVIRTDYDNYAIFYICGKMGDVVTGDNYLVLSRTKDSPTNPAVADALKSLGLDLNTFIKRKDTDCQDPNFEN